MRTNSHRPTYSADVSYNPLHPLRDEFQAGYHAPPHSPNPYPLDSEQRKAWDCGQETASADRADMYYSAKYGF